MDQLFGVNHINPQWIFSWCALLQKGQNFGTPLVIYWFSMHVLLSLCGKFPNSYNIVCNMSSLSPVCEVFSIHWISSKHWPVHQWLFLRFWNFLHFKVRTLFFLKMLSGGFVHTFIKTYLSFLFICWPSLAFISFSKIGFQLLSYLLFKCHTFQALFHKLPFNPKSFYAILRSSVLEMK